MSPEKVEPLSTELPQLRDVFNDTSEIWVGYPLSNSPVVDRPTSYLIERSKLAGHFQNMHDLIFPRDGLRELNVRKYADAVDGLLANLRYWRERLPSELVYEWPMSIAVWELQFVLPSSPRC